MLFRIVEDLVLVKENHEIIRNMNPNIRLELMEPNYPFGRCINLGPGIRALNTTIEDILFSLEANTVFGSSIKILYKDPISGDYLIPYGFESKRDSTKIDTRNKNQWTKLRTTISLFEHTKGDPKYDCENYSKEKTYRQCMEEQLVEYFHNLIGCHPPLISSKKQGVCNTKFDLNKDDIHAKEIQNILQEVIDGYESKTCKPPCQKYVFETDKLYEMRDDNYENEVRIVFSKKVEHTKTYFLIKIPDFLTRIGGAVAGGRTLMWLLLTIFGFSKLVEKLRHFIMKK